MSLFTRLRPLALALGSAALLCGFPSTAGAVDPYEINVILPLTGGFAFTAKEEGAALTAIETMVNRSGGIKGRPIKFVFFDDQSTPQVSLQLATQIIAKKVPFFLGPSAVASCNALVPLVKDGPVMYCFSPGLYTERGSYAFSSNIATRDMLAVTVKYFHAKGWTKVALISPTDANPFG